MNIAVDGKMEQSTDKGDIHTHLGRYMRANGKMVRDMDKELKHQPILVSIMKVSGKIIRKMEQGFVCFKTVLIMTAS